MAEEELVALVASTADRLQHFRETGLCDFGSLIAELRAAIAPLSRMSDLELLAYTTTFLSDVQDEGPSGEGWKSDDLKALLAEIERRYGPSD